MDKIIIKGLRVFAFHGVNPPEKEKGQPFILDVTLRRPLANPGQSDDLNDTVNYSTVVKTIQSAMLAEKHNLIERAAECVAEEILCAFPSIIEVDVLLKKPRAPIAADFDYVAVEISRRRR